MNPSRMQLYSPVTLFLIILQVVMGLPDAASVNFQLSNSLKYDKGMTMSNTHLDIAPSVPLPHSSNNNDTAVNPEVHNLPPRMPNMDDSFIMRHRWIFIILALGVWGTCFYCFYREGSKLPAPLALSRKARSSIDADDDAFDGAQHGSEIIAIASSSRGRRGNSSKKKKKSSSKKSNQPSKEDRSLNTLSSGSVSIAINDDEEEVDEDLSDSIVVVPRVLSASAHAHAAAAASAASNSSASSSAQSDAPPKPLKNNEPGSAEALVTRVLSTLSIPEYSMSVYTHQLKDNWLTTVDQLTVLDDNDWARLSLPAEIERHIRVAVEIEKERAIQARKAARGF